MKNLRLKALGTSVLLLATALPASAALFNKSGVIERILEGSAIEYGACMVKIDTSIGNNCSSSWVSLDCDGTYFSPAAGKRKFAMALTAMATGMTVTIRVDNSKTFVVQSASGTTTYCVADRVILVK